MTSHVMPGVAASRFEDAATLVLFADDGSVAYVQNTLDGGFSLERFAQPATLVPFVLNDGDVAFRLLDRHVEEALVWTHPDVTLHPDRRVRIERFELWDEAHQPLMWGECRVTTDPKADLVVSGLRAEFYVKAEDTA